MEHLRIYGCPDLKWTYQHNYLDASRDESTKQVTCISQWQYTVTQQQDNLKVLKPYVGQRSSSKYLSVPHIGGRKKIKVCS